MRQPAIVKVGRDRPLHLQRIARAMFEANEHELKVAEELYSAICGVLAEREPDFKPSILMLARLVVAAIEDASQDKSAPPIGDLVAAFAAYVNAVIEDDKRQAAGGVN